MSEQKHTPGPWESGNGTTSIYGSDGKEVARRIWHGPQDDERSLANARLIAAAPELLALLNRIVSESVRVEYEEDGPACAEMAYSLIDEVRAAIAKATGGAS